MYKIYTKPNCQGCFKAKRLLDSKEIEYQEVRIGVDITKELLLELLLEMAPFARSAPLIFLNETYIGGFNELQDHINRKYQGNMLLE